MTITIKNDEVERTVRELALRTGQTLTGAIASAVARELAATPRTHETRQERYDRLRRLSQETGRYIRERNLRFLTDDDLYDELGLPK